MKIRQFNLISVAGKVAGKIMKGLQIVKDKGIDVNEDEYDVVDWLQKGQYNIINVSTDFKILSDPFVFSDREMLLHNRLIKDFL